MASPYLKMQKGLPADLFAGLDPSVALGIMPNQAIPDNMVQAIPSLEIPVSAPTSGAAITPKLPLQSVTVKGSMALPGAGTSSPKEDLQRKIEEQWQSDLNSRRQGIAGYDDKIKQLGEQKDGLANLDLGGLAALADAWGNGSHFSSVYKRPENVNDRAAQIQALQQAKLKAQGELSDDQMAYLKAKMDEQARKEQTAMWNAKFGEKSALARERIDLQKDRFKNALYQQFNNDSILKGYQSQQANIGNGMHLLDNPPSGIITNNMLHEITQNLASSLRAGASSTGNERDKMSYETAASQLAGFEQYLSGAPTDAAPPAIVAHLREQLARLHENIGANSDDRIQELLQGNNYSNPEFNKAIQTKAKAGMSTPAPKKDNLESMSDDELAKLYKESGGN